MGPEDRVFPVVRPLGWRLFSRAAEKVLFEGAGHPCYLDQPQRFHEALLPSSADPLMGTSSKKGGRPRGHNAVPATIIRAQRGIEKRVCPGENLEMASKAPRTRTTACKLGPPVARAVGLLAHGERLFLRCRHGSNLAWEIGLYFRSSSSLCGSA